ncbi:MAG: amidohydrolase family protein, partial [Pseudothermotoga sp.]
AGSTLTLDEAVRNTVFKLNINVRNAIMMATYSAARSSNLDLGSILPGSCADLVALDENLNVLATFVSGELVYRI